MNTPPQPHPFWDTVYQDAIAAGCRIDLHASFFARTMQVYRWVRMRPFFACVFWLRVNQLFVRKHWRGHFRLKLWRQRRFANEISEYATIGPGLFLPHLVDVTIGSRAVIGSNVTIYNGVTLGSKYHNGDNAMPQLGNNVIIYTGAKIIGRVTIGDNAEVGALALCLKDVPANSVMYGIPPNVTIKPKTTREAAS